MEFRLSESRAKGIKEFALQILNTTLAVIIALSFDGLVEWRRNRKLVETAETHMDGEMRDNRKDVSMVMNVIAQNKREIEERLKFTNEVLVAREAQAAGRPVADIEEKSWTFNTFGIVLSSASRSTAEATGSLGHMNYAEVKRYAEVYAIQQEFMRIRERLADQVAAVHPVLKTGVVKLSIGELQSVRANMLVMQQTLSDLQGYGKLLLKFYDNALERR